MTTNATAEQLATAVYRALDDADDFDELPDGTQSITLNGWKLRIFDDSDDSAPYGLSWWIDSPDERGVESDGWEVLPTAGIDDEAQKLAALLEQVAS